MSVNKNTKENQGHSCSDHNEHKNGHEHGKSDHHGHNKCEGHQQSNREGCCRHQNKGQDHKSCGHEHHHHGHQGCGHDHHHSSEKHISHQRHVFSAKEMQSFESETIENLMQKADDFLTEEEFGKVVPIFEIVLSKLLAQNSNTSNSISDIMNIKQNLAFSYGIIEEHNQAIPLWKSVIEYKERHVDDVVDLLDDYFGIALSCEQCEKEDEFLTYIQKGLKLAQENKLDDYVASFEHELGCFYCGISHFEKSETHLKQAIKIREKISDFVGLCMSKMYMGILLEEQKKYNEAKEFYDSALELAKHEDYQDELVEERAELELRLSKIQNLNLKNKLFNL